jgi:type I restriction enzyme S subunit
MSWRSVPLKHLTALNRRTLDENYPDDVELSYAEISDVTLGEPIRWQAPASFGSLPSRARRCVATGDVVVSTVRTYLRAIASVVDPPVKSVVSTGFAVLTPQSIDPGYLSFVVQSQQFISQVAAGSVGVSYPAINASDLVRIQVAVPDNQEQRQIADYPDHETAEVDAFISDLELLMDITRERQTAEASEVFAQPSSRVPLKRLNLRKSGGVSVNGSNRPAESGEYGVLKTACVTSGRFRPAENKVVDLEDEILRLAGPVRKGSLIVNRANTPDLVGSAAYVSEDYPDLFLSDLLWELTGDPVTCEYLAAWTRSKSYWGEIQGIRVGTSPSMQKISFEKFSALEVPLPPRDVQMAVVSRLSKLADAADSTVELAGSAIALAKERRTALISAAVTGQIDVTNPHTHRKPTVDQIQDELEAS